MIATGPDTTLSPEGLRAVKLFGTLEPVPVQRVLRAGALSATFENGALRWVRIGEVEVVRGIGFLVRDRNWSTPAAELSNLVIDETPDHFVVRFDAVNRTPDGAFAWLGEIEGHADGRLACRATGSSPTDFVTCRTGFVVLHPLAGVAGARAIVGHTDGSSEDTVIPLAISPEQNFLLIRSITTEPAPGMRAVVTMTGDSWEMEDHRNWSDASFKTYNRPLAMPWPYTIPGGEGLEQAVELVVEGALPPARPGAEPAVTIAVGGAGAPVPSIGLSLLPEDAETAAGAAGLVRALGPGHVNARIDGRRADWPASLAAYSGFAGAVGSAVTLEIVVPHGTNLPAFVAAVAKRAGALGVMPSAVIVSPEADLVSYPPGKVPPPGVPGWEEVADAARRAFPDARIGGGMLSNFAELNRKRPPRGLFDFVTHATSHIVHAADDQSVMETLESVPHMIASTRAFMGDVPCRIGPSHIGNSFNPYGGVSDNPDNRRVTVARFDPRQRGLFAAAWATGYVAAAFAGGLEALTIGSPAGPFGVTASAAGRHRPWFDAHPEALLHPIYHVLRIAARARGGAVLRLSSSDPSRAAGFGFVQDGRRTLVIANLTAAPLPVAGPGLPAAVLDADTFEAAARQPDFLDRGGGPLPGALDAYAVAVLRDA